MVQLNGAAGRRLAYEPGYLRDRRVRRAGLCRCTNDPRFAFGTWKIEILGGFASAIFLLGVAVMMVIGSIERIVSPQPIQYKEAIAVAILGLAVTVVCALIPGKAHHHGHSHGHGHDHHGLKLKSAYLHVIADAATSVLAIAVVTHDRARTPDAVRSPLAVHEEIVHSTIEIYHHAGLRESPAGGAA